MKKILSLLLVVVMVFSMSSVAFAADFNDSVNIPQSDAIDVIETLGIVEGYEDGHFRPHTVLTRAELCTMLTRALYGDPIYVKENVFKDVPNHWAKPYIYTAYANGMMEGYGNGYFGPEDEITYTQMAAVIMKALGYDCAKLGWADGVVSMAHTLGIFDGVDFNSYAEGCTRADAAQMIFNAFDLEYVNHKGDFPKTVNNTSFISTGFGFVEIENGVKEDGHIYEAYRNINDPKAEVAMTDNRLTTTKAIFAAGTSSYKLEDKEDATISAFDWAEVELYVNGERSMDAAAFDEKNDMTGSFLGDKLIAVFVEIGPEYYYVPTGEGDMPAELWSKVSHDKSFNRETSVVKFFRETGKYEILNKVDYGWVTDAHKTYICVDGTIMTYDNEDEMIAKNDFVRIVYGFENEIVKITSFGKDPYKYDMTNKIAHTFECPVVAENIDCEIITFDGLTAGTHSFKNCDKCHAKLNGSITVGLSVEGWNYYHDGNCEYILNTNKPLIFINPLITDLEAHTCIH